VQTDWSAVAQKAKCASVPTNTDAIERIRGHGTSAPLPTPRRVAASKRSEVKSNYTDTA
jgi:hypothetical protein